jgi:plastocyanin
MRTLKLLGTVIVALAVAGPAQAAVTKTVTIKTGGFTPKNVTIATGDSIKWVNNDTVNRQVVATGGQFASPVIAPKASWTRVFNVAGTFNYRDVFKSAQTGRIRVTGPPPSVSLAATAPIIAYGGTVTLGGKVSDARAGEQVTIWGKPYGSVSYVQLGVVLTGDAGLWSYPVKPELLTSYQVQWKNLKSAEISLAVEPKLVLKRVGAWFVARVYATRSFRTRWVYVQRRSRLGQWVNVRKVVFGTATAQRFKVRDLPSGQSRIRLFMTVNQAGVGYLASDSNTLVVRRG